MPLQLVIQLSSDSSAIQSRCLVLLQLSLQTFIQLFDIVIQSFSIALHLLNNKLKFIFLSFFFFSSSFKLLLFYLKLSLSFSHLILDSLILLSLLLLLLVMLLSLFFPPSLNILNKLGILFLYANYFLLKAFYSDIQGLIFYC